MKAVILSLIPILTILLFFFVILKSKQPSKDYVLFCLYFFPVIYSADFNLSVFQIITYCYYLYSLRNNKPIFSNSNYFLTLFVVVTIVLGALSSEFVSNSIIGLLRFLPIIIYIHILLLECLKDDEFIFKVVSVLKIALVISFVFLLLQIGLGLNFSLFLADNPNITFESIRYPGIFQDPQKFAQFLAALSFVALIKKPGDNNFSKYNYLLFGAAVISLFLTGGRAALLGLVVGLSIIIAFSNMRIKFFGVLGGILIFALIISLGDYFIVFSRGESLKDSYEIRNAIWKEAYKIYLNHPLLGIGINNYSSYVELYVQDQFWLVNGEKQYFDHPESGYLKFLTELGILGTAGIFTFILSAIYRGLRTFLYKVKDFNIIYLIAAIFSWAVGFYSVFSLGDARIMVMVATLTVLLICYAKRYDKGFIIIDENATDELSENKPF